MPEIKQYTTQVRAPGPTRQMGHSAAEHGGLEAQAVGQFGGAVVKAADAVATRLDQENTSDVTAKLTKTNADLAIELQELIRTAEPGDKKAFEDYNKRVEDSLSKVGEDATTGSARQFYTEASAKIKAQLYKTSMDGQSELAGVKAVNDYTSTLNSLSSVAYADPSSVQLQRELHKASIENLVKTGQLPREKALELEKHGESAIVKSTLRGWAGLNPGYAKAKLKSGEFDSVLGAEGKIQIESEIDQAERAKEIELERRERDNERIRKEQTKVTQNKFLVAMQESTLTEKDVLNSDLDAFGSGSKEQFLQMLKTKNSPAEKLKTDSGTMISLYNRIHLPEGDPQKLVDENELNTYFGRGLSLTDLNHLRDEMQGKNTAAGQVESDMKRQLMEVARGRLSKSNPLTGFKDPIGDEQMLKFMSYFYNETQKRKAKGQDITELLTPDNPEYIGKMIDQYVRTPQEIMRSMVPKKSKIPMENGIPVYNAPKPAPRKEGESAADYLKRIKGGG